MFVNHAPVANDDVGIVVYQNFSVLIDSLANDYDKDGGIYFIFTLCCFLLLTFFFLDNLTISQTYNSTGGVTIIEDNEILYTPRIGFEGNDILFNFKIGNVIYLT